MDAGEAIHAFMASNPGAKLHHRIDEAGLVLGISGSLDLQLSYALQKLLQSAVEDLAAGKRLAIDLSQVTYISSAGVGALTSALVSARQKNVGMTLGRIPPSVRSILEILGLLSFFPEEDFDA
jgi:anti-sigma B factor antagonist